jgi:hypothetical protein
MRFFTSAECREWCAAHAVLRASEDGAVQRHARTPARTDVAFCRALEQVLQPRDRCLLWVTDWGVWRSSENLHLYYRLRQSYGDVRLLEEAPGHLFLSHESADLVSFFQVGLLCGWDMHLIPAEGYGRAFMSHDEFVAFAANEGNDYLVDEFLAG